MVVMIFIFVTSLFLDQGVHLTLQGPLCFANEEWPTLQTTLSLDRSPTPIPSLAGDQGIRLA